MNLLLTGPPRCGKTTLVGRVVDAVGDRVALAGFITGEVRSGGARVGFDVRTLDGAVAPLSRKGTGEGPRVGPYRVDTGSLEGVAVASLDDPGAEAFVVDEIGLMELKSRLFKEAVERLLEDGRPLLATVRWRAEPFCDGVKARPDVELLRVTPGNRDGLVEEISTRLMEAAQSR